jgi:TonB family protein
MIVTFVVNSLWQGLIVAALTAAFLKLVPLRNAATRYAVWFFALLALIAIPSLATWWHAGAQLVADLHRAAPRGNGTYSLVFAGTIVDGTARWLAFPHVADNPLLTRGVITLWIAGAAVGFLRLGVSALRIRRLLAAATPFSTIDGVTVLSSTELSIPIATGVTSPAIVVPADMASAAEADDLRCTLEHELAHVRRGDVAGNTFQRIVEAIFFWNPWIALAGRKLVAEREAACDDRAALRIGEPRDYALCLAALGRRIAEKNAPLLTPGAFGSRNALVARIERLMADGAPGDSRLNVIALGGVLMIFAALTLVFQALAPSPVNAAPLQAPAPSFAVAATCTKPDAEPGVTDPAQPQLAKPQWPKQKVSAEVAVTIAPNGKVTGAKIYKSSGDAAVDAAALTAAEKSKYTPKMVNCVAVQGSYLFKADFAP